MIVVTLLSLVLVVTAAPLPAPGYSVSAVTGQPTGEAMPGYIRLLTPLPNITGGGALLLGAAVLGLRVHAQEARARLLARPRPAGRPVPVQPVHRGRRDPRQLRRVAARRAARAGGGPPPLAGAGDAADRASARSSRRSPTRSTGPARRTCTSWASSWACCSCSPGSSSRWRCSARSASRSPRSASGRRGASGRGGATRRSARATPRSWPRGATRAARRPRATDAGRDGPRGCRPAAAMLSPMDGPRTASRSRRRHGSRCCWSTTTPSCDAGLHGFFELLDDIEVVGEAEDGQRAVELVGTLEPDVVLMDLLMPVMDGIAATAEIKAALPGRRGRRPDELHRGGAGHRRPRGRGDRLPAEGRRCRRRGGGRPPGAGRRGPPRPAGRAPAGQPDPHPARRRPGARAADRPRARGAVPRREGPLQQGDRRASSTSPSGRPAPTSRTSSASSTWPAARRPRSGRSSTSVS